MMIFVSLSYSNDDIYMSFTQIHTHPLPVIQSLSSYAEVTYFITNNNVYAAYEVGLYIKYNKCE